jgi:hypothetical protein
MVPFQSFEEIAAMGQIVQLIELVERLAEWDDDETTIYACEPWTEASDAMVALPDPERKPYAIPLEVVEAGMNYFLDVFIAREVVEGLIAFLGKTPNSTAICQRLIEYATYDA